jgi:alcohol dehydrogenase class IV
MWFNQSVHFRKGAISVLKELAGLDILVISYPGATENEAYSKALSNLEANTIHQEICNSATESEIRRMRTEYSPNPPSLIIGIGGGQVMDSAKILRVLLENPNREFSSLFEEDLAARSIQYIAIPTTPSTGSEANGTAVVKNDEGVKMPYVSRMMVPDTAILDPSFLATLSDSQIFTFLGDIFGHANESMVSKRSNPISKSISDGIISLLKEVSPALHDQPGNMKALDKLMQAGYLGGMAAGSVFVGVCHALAHSLEQQMGLTHAAAVLTLTPGCLNWHSTVTDDKIYSRLLDDFETIGLNDYLQPQILDGVDKDVWAKDALADPSIKTSPIRMKEDNLAELIEWLLTK